MKVPNAFRSEKNLEDKTKQLVKKAKTCYEFKLNEDLPSWFKTNKWNPGLPAMYNYLKLYDNERFGSLEDFEKNVIDNFLDYLKENNIAKSKHFKLEICTVEDFDIGYKLGTLHSRLEDAYIFVTLKNPPNPNFYK